MVMVMGIVMGMVMVPGLLFLRSFIRTRHTENALIKVRLHGQWGFVSLQFGTLMAKKRHGDQLKMKMLYNYKVKMEMVMVMVKVMVMVMVMGIDI